MTFEIPAALRAARTVAGESAWLDALPELVDALASDWSLEVGRARDSFAVNALVVEVTTADGVAAVAKIGPPSERDKLAREATVLRLAGGEGCVRLLRHDLDRRVLLLERLGPSMYELGVKGRPLLDQLCDAAMRLWRPVDRDAGLRTGAAYATHVATRIPQVWDDTGRSWPEPLVADAIACAERRAAAHDDERAVLCHGDLHEQNALQAADGGFKLIDPEGVCAEPEYDLGVIMRCDPARDDLHERADWLAAKTGRDRTAIWEWGAAERVLSGLWCLAIGLQPRADNLLADAERLCAR